jgi:Large polyvalent protein-associated domain 7
VAAVTGLEDRAVRRLQFSHRVERSGTVIFNLGQGRIVTDSINSKQVQLNNLAASSPEAIATALRFATAKFGNTLTLAGSPEFQRLAVETAVYKKIGIKFADPVLENYRRTLMEKQNALSNRNQQDRAIPPAHLRSRLLDLSDGDLVLDIVGNELPLQQDVPSGMDKQQTKQNSDLQRTAGRASGAGGTGGSRDTRTDLPSTASAGAGDIDHHLTPTPSTRPNGTDVRAGVNGDGTGGSITENPSERSGLHADTESVSASIDAWRSEHSEMVETKQLDGSGKVLHVFSDGQWIQNRSGGRQFALQPSSNIEIKIGQNVEVDRRGSVKLITSQKISI